MGLYNLPSNTEELEKDLVKLMPNLPNLNIGAQDDDKKTDDSYASLREELQKLQKTYLAIVSGEKTQLDDEACANMAALEMRFSPDNKDDADKLKAKYSNMSINDAVKHMNTFWQTAMMQGDMKHMQDNYAILSKNDNAAQKLKFDLWKQDLDGRLASVPEFKDKISDITGFFKQVLIDRDDKELSNDEKEQIANKILEIETSLGFANDNLTKLAKDQATKSIRDLRTYCRLRMANLAEYATMQVPVPPYEHIENAVISDDFPEIDNKLLAWKLVHQVQQGTNNQEVQKEAASEKEVPVAKDNSDQKVQTNSEASPVSENPASVSNSVPNSIGSNIAFNKYPVFKLAGRNSKLMADMKNSIVACEMAMNSLVSTNEMNEKTESRLDHLEEEIIYAVSVCRKYYKKHKDKKSPEWKMRLRAVSQTMAIMKQQYSQLSALRKMIDDPATRGEDYPKGEYDIRSFMQYVDKVEKEKKIEEPENSATPASLTYTDFINVLSPWNGDYVEFNNGQLHAATNVIDTVSWWRTNSKDNRHMLEQLAKLAVVQEVKGRNNRGKKSSDKFKEMRLKAYREMLGLDNGKEMSGPIPMTKLRNFVKFVDAKSSKVDTIFDHRENYTHQEFEMAEAVRHAVPVYKATDLNLLKDKSIEEIQEIVKTGQAAGVKTELTQKRLEELASGHMSAISDIAYSLIYGTYQCVRNFEQQEVTYSFPFTKPELVEKVVAYAVKIEAATSEKEKRRLRAEAGEFCAQYAFTDMKQSELLDEINKYRLAKLSAGADGLREYVISIFSTVKDWQGKEREVAEGTAKLEKLCNLMREHRQIVEKIAVEGLTSDRETKLKGLGSNIQALITDERSMELMQLVASNIPKTRIKAGMEELQELLKQENPKFDYTVFTAKLCNVVNTKHKSYYKDTTKLETFTDEQRKQRLQPESIKLVDVFLLKSQASEFITEGQKDADKIRELYTELKDMEVNDKSWHTMNLGQSTAEFAFNEKGNVKLEVDGMSFDTGCKPSLIAQRIAEDMCEHADMYGLEIISDVFGDALKDVAAGKHPTTQLNFEMLANLLKYTANIEKKDLRDYSCKDLADMARQSLEKRLQGEEVNTEEVLNELITRDKGEAAKHLLDKEVIDAVSELTQDVKNGLSQKRVQFKDKFDEKSANNDKIQWEADELAVKEFLSDLIWPSDEWKYELSNRNNSADRIRYTIYNHADTVAKIVQNPNILENIISKLKLKEMGLNNLNIEDLLFNKEKGALNILKIESFTKGHMPKTEEVLKKCTAQEMGNIIRGIVGEAEDVNKASATIKELIKKLSTKTLIDELAKDHMDVLMKLVDDKRNPGDLKPEEKDAIIVKLHSMFDMIGQHIETSDSFSFLGSVAKVLNKGSDVLMDKVLRDFWSDLRQNAKMKESLENVDKEIADLVHDTIIPNLQGQINARLNDNVFAAEKNIFIEAGDPSVSDLLNSNFTGESGQSLFSKKIIQGYFTQAGVEQQRGMIASAFRELKPSQLTNEVKPRDKEKLNQEQLGSFMSGLFKGAGPLMHKTLQGIPVKNLPLSLQIALDATKSHLNHIPKEIVTAQMNRMVKDSHGTISNIEIQKSLGAASVGEAFLCKLYGPDLQPEGREVVIKLLRPDVRKRMDKEKDFFMTCATETNSGMARTFAGQLEIYEKELDLCIEAKNALEGRVYNGDEENVKSEELVGLIKPSTGVLALEKADGTTLGSYFKEVQKKRDEYIQNNKTPYDITATIKGLTELMSDLSKKQEMITTLADKWVTEAVYKSGFYQADLHKDNIMVGEKAATVIDYGNATLLTEEQRTHIMHMVTCAGLGLATDFADHYAALLSESSRKQIYTAAKEKEFKAMVQNIMDKDGDAGSKIAVILMEAQKMGLELPSAVYNFSQGQLRLQNSIDDGNELLQNLSAKLELIVDKHWSDHTDLLHEFRESYVNKPKATSGSIRKELDKKLIVGQTTTDDNINQIVELLNNLLLTDGKDIEKLSKFVGEDILKDEVFGFEQILKRKKENPNYEITADMVKFASKHPDASLLQSFCGVLEDALIQEAKVYMQAKKLIADAENPTDFLRIMSRIINSRQKQTMKLLGMKASAKYALNMNSYDAKRKEKQDRIDNLQEFQISHLCSLCGHLVAATKVLSTALPNGNLTEADKQKVKHEMVNIAEKLYYIPDTIMPLQSKRFILDKIGVYKLDEAESAFKKHMDGAGGENAGEVTWIDRDAQDRLLNSQIKDTTLYNLREDLRLAYGYIDRILKTKAGRDFYNGQQQKNIDSMLRSASRLINDLEMKPETEEKKQNVNAQEKTGEPLNTEGEKHEAENKTENINTSVQHEQPVNSEAEKPKAEEKVETEEKPEAKEPENKEPEAPKTEMDSNIPKPGSFKTELDQIKDHQMAADAIGPEYYGGYYDYVHPNGKFDRNRFEEINSNDIEVLQRLKEAHNGADESDLRKYLDRRIKSLQHIKQIADQKQAAGPKEEPITDDKGTLVLSGVTQKARQNTNNGCWSVALASLLSYRGINLDQEDIRAFRPDSKAFGEKELTEANSDTANELSLYTDMIQKMLPATAVNKLACNHQMTADQAKNLLWSCIYVALKYHNSPLAILYAGHYRTIYGFQDGQVIYLNPRTDTVEAMPIDNMVAAMQTSNGTYKFTAEWFQDLQFDSHREPVLGGHLLENGASYLGGKLTQNSSTYVNATNYKGFVFGTSSGIPIVSYLPTEIKLKDKKLDNFNITVLDNIVDTASGHDDRKEVIDTLKEHPESKDGAQIQTNAEMIKWGKKLQALLKKDFEQVPLTEKEKADIRCALEEVRHTLIVQAKQDLKTEINKKFRLRENRITYPVDEKLMSDIKPILDQASMLSNVEQMNVEQEEWMNYFDPQKQAANDMNKYKTVGVDQVLDDIARCSAEMGDWLRRDSRVLGSDNCCSADIPIVKLLSEIEAGRLPDKNSMQQMVVDTAAKIGNISKEVKAQEREYMKKLEAKFTDKSEQVNTNEQPRKRSRSVAKKESEYVSVTL